MNSKETLEYFIEMKECNQLDYGEEKEKCDLIEKDLELLYSIIDGITYKEKHKYVLCVERKGQPFILMHSTIRGEENVKRLEELINGNKNRIVAEKIEILKGE